MSLRARIITGVVVLIAGIFLAAACAPSPAATADLSQLQQTVSAAQAATAQVEATRQAATVAAVYFVQTVDATTRQAGTATAVAVVTQQAIVDADMTRTFAVATLERAQELDDVEDNRVAIEMENRRSALVAADQLNQQIVTDNQRRLDQAAAKRDQQNAIAYTRSMVLVALMALLGLAVFIFIVAAIFDRFHRIRRREEALRILQGPQPQPDVPQLPASAVGGAGTGRLTISKPADPPMRLSALPPQQRVQLLQQSAASLAGHVANWDEFARWRKPGQVVIGVGPSGPVVFNLSLLPHIFAAGATRKGKSTLVRVLLAYLATSGYNVVILNERSSDFATLGTLPSVLNLRGFSAAQRLRLAQDAFAGAVEEMNRRDGILHAAGIPTWNEFLRQNPHEAPPTFIFVDEFLELAQGNRQAQDGLMRDALTISSQAGKFGIGIGLNATDPTQRALGDVGYSVIQNCARICLGVNTTYASVSVLGDASAFGLPAGQFIAIDHDGQRHAGIGFNPRPEQLSAYVRQYQPANVRPFPVAITAVSRSLTAEETQDDLDTVDPELSRIIEDSQVIATLSGSGRIGRSADSRSAICEVLYDLGHIGWGRTGPNVRRVELALAYMASKGDQWAATILAKSRTTALTVDDKTLVGRVRAIEQPVTVDAMAAD